MPPPIERSRRYVSGLDGIRALAVVAVIAYHLNLKFAPGGNLGVGIFFTLSGYLITDLLLGHWRRHANLGLKTFWLRRARRLLPALFLMLAVVSIWVAVFHAAELGAVRKQVLAASLYFSNWSTIAMHGSYFARFAAPLPLDHLWSLAIEEQFYLLWPWIIGVAILLVRSRARLALLTLVAAAGSAVAMGLLYHPGLDPTRVYEGTDTRAFGLLVGAALAMVWPSDAIPAAAARPRIRDLIDGLAVLGFVAIVVLVWRTSSFSRFLYPYGFVLLAFASAAIVAAVVNPASRLGPILGWTPLRWIGVRSYGIYLWQSPIIVLVGPVTGPDFPRAVLDVVLTFAIAAVSWRLVEEPIRRGGLGRLYKRFRSGVDRLHLRRQVVVLSSVCGGLLAVALLGLAGALPVASAGHAPNSTGPLLAKPKALSKGKPPGPGTPVSNRTGCRSVVYIGDSTSEGENSTDYIPNARQRLPAQLADVGVKTTYDETSGARSIVETFEGKPNAATVAQDHLSAGFNGCWIFALGTNDVDNVHTGSTVAYPERISRMMALIGQQPAIWIDVVTLLGSGPYSESNMQQWNDALLAACKRYPNMRVFDWAAHAKRKWFIPDGIHYYSPGYVARSHDIARGLAHAFPGRGQSPPGCVVT
jgi:peptidoglycan/LPS O-acetylase OafA/YrhL